MFVMDRHSERIQIYNIKYNTPADALNLHNITNIFDAIKYSSTFAFTKIMFHVMSAFCKQVNTILIV